MKRDVVNKLRTKMPGLVGAMVHYVAQALYVLQVIVCTFYRYIHPNEVVKASSNGAGVATPRTGPSREKLVARLASEEYDVLVIGGGCTGCGAALEALSRGLSVALVEKVDFGAGTSGASTKLLHGGVRYLTKALAKRDASQFQLVSEALQERGIMMKQAPHLTKPIPILTPLYSWREVPKMLGLLKLYDIMAGEAYIGSSYYINAENAIKRFPQIQKNGLVGAIVYYDGQFDDARFNVACATTIADENGAIANYVEVIDLFHNEAGEVAGARAIDKISGSTFTINAKCVVNATGHFADSVRKMDAPDAKKCMVAAQGTHIVLNKSFCAETEGLLIPKTDDGRVVFLLPFQGCTLAGTTDGPCEISDQPKPTKEQIAYIISHINRYFAHECNISDVQAAWAGIRPLKKDDDSKETASMSREHGIFTSPSGLLTIVGGKWTTYRKMAEDIVNHAIATALLQPSRTSTTTKLKLTGAAEFNATHSSALIEKYSLPADIAVHLNLAYGDQAEHVCSMGRDSDMLQRLAPAYPYIEAEVIYCMRREFAERAIDILARRTRLAFLDHDAAQKCTGRVVEIMAEEKGWMVERKNEEMATVRTWLSAWSQADIRKSAMKSEKKIDMLA